MKRNVIELSSMKVKKQQKCQNSLDVFEFWKVSVQKFMEVYHVKVCGFAGIFVCLRKAMQNSKNSTPNKSSIGLFNIGIIMATSKVSGTNITI